MNRVALLNPQVTKLPNGLTVVVIPHVGDTVEITAFFKDGSRGDSAEKAGELHKLEHLVFKGTKKFPHWRDINQLLRWYGRDDGASAVTAHEFVQFYVRGLPEQLEEMTFFLSELTLRPRIIERAMKRELEKETSVILTEHFMDEDILDVKVDETVWQMIYRDHPLGQAVDGTPETIKAIKRKDIISRWHQTFRTENALVVVHGPIGERSPVKYIKLNFRARKRKQNAESAVWTTPMLRPQPLEKRVKLERYPSKEFWVAVGFPTKGLQEPNRFATRLLSRILGEGWGSLIMMELREKYGIGYHPYSEAQELSDAGMFLIAGNFVPEQFVNAIRLTQAIIRRLITKPVDEDTLKAAKTSLKADFRSWAEEPAWVADYIYEQWMTKGQSWTTGSKIQSIESLFDKIDQVSADDVRRAARRIFRALWFFVSIIGPFTDELESQTMRLLKNWKFIEKKTTSEKPVVVVEEKPVAVENPTGAQEPSAATPVTDFPAISES